MSFAALCCSTNIVRRYNTPLTLLSLGFLVFSYLTRVVRIFATAARLTQDWLRIIPGIKFKKAYLLVEKITESKSSQTSRFVWSILKMTLKIIYVLMKAVYEIQESMLWEVGFRSRRRTLNQLLT